MIFTCGLPCCTATEDKPLDFKPCVACQNINAHHVCSITTASELDYEENLLKDDLETNLGVQFCSMICASEHNNNLKAKKEADDVIRVEDMKDDEKYFTFAIETCFAMAEERGLFAGDAKARTVNDIVEDIKMTKKQMADLKAMEADSIFSDDSDAEDSSGDSDSDEEEMNTCELAIASLKKRLKELKSELKNHGK